MYQHTIEQLRSEITCRWGGTIYPINRDGDYFKTHPLFVADHLLWMCLEVETMTNVGKAGRWIGWMLAWAENLGLWTNERSRQLIRIDVEAGNA